MNSTPHYLLALLAAFSLGLPAAGSIGSLPSSAVRAEAEQPPSFGLVYLSDPRGLVAYAYRLADSEPLPSAELRLLDARRELLASCAVKDGLAQRDTLPAGTRYLQLCCGEECLTVDAWDRVGRAHPDAPDVYARQTQSCTFLDRRTYRPGDAVRLGGIRRDIRDGVLHYPENRRLLLEYELPDADGMRQHRQEVTLAEDGTFLAEFTLPQDMRGIRRVPLYVPTGSYGGRALFKTIEVEAEPCPALRLDGLFSVEGRQAAGTAFASTADGCPLAGRELRWSLQGRPAMLLPEGCEEYFFGDGRPAQGTPRGRRGVLLSARTVTDAEGRAHATFTLPPCEFPQPLLLTLNADFGYSRTPGGITHREQLRLEPAALAVGLRRASAYSKPGEELELGLMPAHASGRRYEGAPVEMELVVRRQAFPPDCFGDELLEEGWTEAQPARRLLLPAGGTSLPLTLEEEGAYDIIVQGRDAEGKAFATVIRQYVWGGERAPWLRDASGKVELSTDRSSYRAGEMVRLSYPGIMEGTAILVIEGEDRRHVLTRRVLAGQRVISFPMRAEYGLTPTLTLALVQAAGPRPQHGSPMLQLGECALSGRKDLPALQVELAEPPAALAAGEPWLFEGCVRDAGGKPLPHATVLLCARDVGATQHVNGGSPAAFNLEEAGRGVLHRLFMDAGDVPALPNPRASFTLQRQPRFCSAFNHGGGVECVPEGSSGTLDPAVFGGSSHAAQGIRARRGSGEASAGSGEGGLVGTALWLRATTDAEGRFRALFTAPAGRTELQLFALACGQPDEFGVAGVLIPVDGK